jgi:gamma-glutamyl hercynylcysteine S-oxide synthase
MYASSPSAAQRSNWLSSCEFSVVLSIAGGLLLAVGLWAREPLWIGGGAAGLCLLARDLPLWFGPSPKTSLREIATRLFRGTGPNDSSPAPAPPSPAPRSKRSAPTPPAPTHEKDPDELSSTGDLVESLVATGRYALLLRSETSEHLTQDQLLSAVRALDEAMSLAPAGKVLLGVAAERATLGGDASGLIDTRPSEGVIEVEAFYIDRWPVTNEQYQEFVSAGGYEQLEFWPEESLPAIFDFVDRTGEASPKYWLNGAYPEGQGQQPVVGISWYEACAYSRWVGKRLPTDAEWTKVGAWPVEASPGRIVQRRYPWGDSFDTKRANLWCAGRGGIVDVDEFYVGDSIGGVRQLVGNVWEWTASALCDSAPKGVDFPSSLKSVRGGAFDTYFENQATCHFQSGEGPLSRRHNIGVRLALSMSQLVSVDEQE